MLQTPDALILNDTWSDVRASYDLKEPDLDRLHAYRQSRLQDSMRRHGVACLIQHSPISLRYAIDYQTYALYQSHMPETYLFMSPDGPSILHGAYVDLKGVDAYRTARAISFFCGGFDLAEQSEKLADDVVTYLSEIGQPQGRVAIEYVNPSLTQALGRHGIEVIDGSPVAEAARIHKSADEITAMTWACAVADLGISKLKETLRPGVTERQLWGILNYTNLANQGDWHDGRMLASGPRTNPWYQEATLRKVEAGELVGFDTDMIGPFGYFADVSRTIHCGPTGPTKEQRHLYQLAYAEVQHNLALVRPGVTFAEFQDQAFQQDPIYHKGAYTCLVHAVGMCDEYPRINPGFRGPNPYEGEIEAGMVLCIESYVGAEGGKEGVKLEQQVHVTEDGYELLSHTPFEESLLQKEKTRARRLRFLPREGAAHVPFPRSLCP